MHAGAEIDVPARWVGRTAAWHPEPVVERIRTYHGRHGRVTPRMASVLDDLGRRRHLDQRPDERRPLVLEVGCGRGEAAMGFAHAHPDVDVLGTDVHTPGVVALLEAAEAAGLTNVYAMRDDAVALMDRSLGSGSLDGVHLFFPDPWPKTRHHKRRFVRPDVLDLVADRLVVGGTFRFATDVAPYADWARRHLDAHDGFEGGTAPRPTWRPVTRYEAAAHRRQRAVIDFAYRRR